MPSGCLVLIGLFLAFILLIVVVVFGALKSTDVYKTALSRAQSHPEVIEALGTPIEDGMFLSGSTKTEGTSGNAELSIPLSGPKGKGTLYVVATKSAGQWSYKTLAVEVKETGRRITIDGAADEVEQDDE